MRRIGFTLLTGLLLLAFAAPATAGDDPVNDLAKAWMESYNAGNDTAVAALYAEDAWRMPPNAETAKSKDAIMKTLEAGRAAGLARIKITPMRSSLEGAEGWGVGTYVGYSSDGTEMDHGKWMISVRKADGKFLVVNDIFNSDLPLPVGDEDDD